jgi:LmbE family N-acetylglucosaminyl deacetylase
VPELAGRVVVLSPHLDDGVFSLGAALALAAGSGADVRILTVFANDVDSTTPAAWWDEAAGFASEGEGARARREEDATACGILGATPSWLPFRDATYATEAEDDATVVDAVVDALADADVVLAPGFPLAHPDHARLTRALLGARDRWQARTGLYVEQPYAKWHARRRPWRVPQAPEGLGVSRDGRWTRLESTRASRRLKRRAALAYESQLPLFARGGNARVGRLLVRRVALYEALRGGEAVLWLGER